MIKLYASLLLLIICTNAKADIFDLPKIETVAQKKYDVKDEITAQFTYLPKDPFSKYINLGASYTHAFSDFTSWEVVNANYVIELASGLKKDLIDNFGRDAATFAVLKYYATSNLVFTPIYTKNLLFNSSVVHSQFSIVAGGGLAGFSRVVPPVIDAGVILRFFTTPNNSLKLDFRYFKFLTSADAITDNYSITVGYSFNIGSTKKEEPGEFEWF